MKAKQEEIAKNQFGELNKKEQDRIQHEAMI